MGNQGGSNPLLGMVQGWVDSGKLGKISKVQIWTNRPVWPQGFAMPAPDESKKPKDLYWDLWLGPAEFKPYTPNLHPFDWRGWWDYGTGALGDVGCHLIDIPFRTLGLKYPTDAECSVGCCIYTNVERGLSSRRMPAFVIHYHPFCRYGEKQIADRNDVE